MSSPVSASFYGNGKQVCCTGLGFSEAALARARICTLSKLASPDRPLTGLFPTVFADNVSASFFLISMKRTSLCRIQVAPTIWGRRPQRVQHCSTATCNNRRCNSPRNTAPKKKSRDKGVAVFPPFPSSQVPKASVTDVCGNIEIF